MIRFVPPKDSFSGRCLAGLGKALGLRSETVYSRAILLTALAFFLLGGLAVATVWYLMFQEFDRADAQEARAAAAAVRSFLAAAEQQPPSTERMQAASALLGREVNFLSSGDKSDNDSPDGIEVAKVPDGGVEASFRLGAGEVVVAGGRPFYETGTEVARLVLVGMAVAAGLALLLILFIVDRTILSRVQLLIDRVEHEKDSERLPVQLGVDGDDEIAQLASSIEELARLVQKAEREYRHVVEDQTESICRFDGEGRITFSNRAFNSLCSLPPVGRSAALESCLTPEAFSDWREALKGLGRGKSITTFTHCVTGPESDRTWYRSTLRAHVDDKGQIIGGQWMAADVTSEVLARKKLQESEKQLALLSGRLMHLQDAERRRIARDLHDSTAQALSALEMNTSLLESAAADDKTRRIAAETRAISRQVCQELRNISYLLHPPLLEEKGLLFAIRWFADGFTKRNNIPVSLDIADDFPRLSFGEETALFRIVQEALSNIYRHAGATKAWITLRQGGEGAVSLEIRDNGEGLPEGFSFETSVGVGLAGMRERMKQLGGTLEVDSSPYGVSVKCRLGATDKT